MSSFGEEHNIHIPNWEPVYLDDLERFEERHFRYIQKLPAEQRVQVQAVFTEILKTATTVAVALAAIDRSVMLLPLDPTTLVAELNAYIRATSHSSGVVGQVWRALVMRVAKNVSLEEIHVEHQEQERIKNELETRFNRLEQSVLALVNESVDASYFVTRTYYRDVVEFLERERVRENMALLWGVLDRLEKKLPQRVGPIKMIREIAHMPRRTRKRILGEEIPPSS